MDAAVLALVRGLVPVPEVLEVRRADPESGLPGLWSPATSTAPGSTPCCPTSTTTWPRWSVTGSAGCWPGWRARCRCCRPGCSSTPSCGALPMPAEARDLPTWVLDAPGGRGAGGMVRGDREQLMAVAERAQQLADAVERTCLVQRPEPEERAR